MPIIFKKDVPSQIQKLKANNHPEVVVLCQYAKTTQLYSSKSLSF